MTQAELKSIERSLHALIKKTLPRAGAEKKYGGTLFLHPISGDHFCGIFKYTAHVTLEFSSGAELKDVRGILNGVGKYRRNIQFKSKNDVEPKVLTPYLRAAYALAK